MKYNPKDYPIQSHYKPDDPVFSKGLLFPDQHIYICCGGYSDGFYVKTRIIEMVYIHVWPEEPDRPSKWMSLYLTQPNPWEPNGVSESVNEIPEGTDLTGSVIVNQFPWVDWPIGHAAYLGMDGFHTLEEARSYFGRFRAKGKFRRAKQYLSRFNFNGNSYVYDEATEQDIPRPPYYPKRSHFYRKIYT